MLTYVVRLARRKYFMFFPNYAKIRMKLVVGLFVFVLLKYFAWYYRITYSEAYVARLIEL